MKGIIKKGAKKRGLPPGTLMHIGKKVVMGKPKITVIDYTNKDFEEKEVEKVEECFPFKSKASVTWINIDGLHDLSVIEKIGKNFDIHPLIQEDIVSTGQRPKIEEFEKHIFVVLNMLDYDEHTNQVGSEQVSLVLGPNFVISFQETIGDVFDFVRARLRDPKRKIRALGADYLLYALLDSIVDNYFVILEKIGERIEDIEEEMVEKPDPKVLQEIYGLKREMIFLRKSVWPLREVINMLEKSESSLIKKRTSIYFSDVYDHTIQVMDSVETFRDMTSGILDLYVSSISNRLNEIMKILTIFSTIFIPLTFMVGVYGMNFKYLPELEWRWGYFYALGLMGLVAVTLLFYFRKKKWI